MTKQLTILKTSGIFIRQWVQKLKIPLLLLFICASFFSCKTSFGIYKEPWKPEGIILDGTCLVNRLISPLPLEKEEEIMSIALKQFTKTEGVGFNYIKFINADSIIEDRIEFVPQPDIMDRIFNELHYKYLLNIFVDASRYKKGGFAWSEITWDLNHQVTADIAIYETESGRMLYTQKVVLTERLAMVSEDLGEERPRKFQLTYSTEGLLKKAVKKCAKDLLKSTKRKDESKAN